MTQMGTGGAGGAGGIGLEQLPYYREYLDQIARPRVATIIEEIRATMTDRVWAEVVERMAEEQGGSRDAASMAKLRAFLEQGLRLRIGTQIAADFEGSGPSAASMPQDGSVVARREEPVVVTDHAANVESGFPNNPLARAVGGVRRVGR